MENDKLLASMLLAMQKIQGHMDEISRLVRILKKIHLEIVEGSDEDNESYGAFD